RARPLGYLFFQAEDGIRDRNVTGVQTCALPICLRGGCSRRASADDPDFHRVPPSGATSVKAGSRIASMNHGASSGSIRPVRTSSAAPLRTTCVVVSSQDKIGRAHV